MHASRRIFADGLLPLAVAALFLTGCSMTPSMPTPEAESELPETYTTDETSELLPAATADTNRAVPTEWWTSLNDPTLDALVDSALVGNLDLRTARARLDELQARFRIARAPLFPSATANATANRQSQPLNTGLGAIFGGGQQGGGQEVQRVSYTTYSATLGLSYELDFWGRIRSQRKAALSQFFASAADLQNTRIAVVSQTISAYTQYVTLQRQEELSANAIALLEDRLATTQDRYNRGIASSFELYSVHQRLEQARADQPPLRAQRYDAQTRLAVLTGRLAGEEQELLSPPSRDSLQLDAVPAGLPSDLIARRPDVMAASARLEAARQQIGVARAEMLPRLSLTAEGGLQSASLDDLLDIDQRFSSLIANLSAPLFQGGALWARVDVTKAQYRQQLAAYEKTLLTAFQEVKSALVADHQQQIAYERVQQQLDAARASFETQRSRYERGIGDYLALLDAEQNLLTVQQRAAAARQQRIAARLTLYRALGGPWTETDPPEDPRFFQ
ncbi:transporter [Longibacter salinarum]|uniref:Transporter n=1 Tax=Longibacter salinarum TaxID=1850348 RepID=A0A2A8CWR4_9BACT|nr:efflux transporter outer membrane subunit [Longibacter salinarum]PEN13132.1 transporter [Longibacter salinarum]